MCDRDGGREGGEKETGGKTDRDVDRDRNRHNTVRKTTRERESGVGGRGGGRENSTKCHENKRAHSNATCGLVCLSARPFVNTCHEGPCMSRVQVHVAVLNDLVRLLLVIIINCKELR